MTFKNDNLKFVMIITWHPAVFDVMFISSMVLYLYKQFILT